MSRIDDRRLRDALVSATNAPITPPVTGASSDTAEGCVILARYSLWDALCMTRVAIRRLEQPKPTGAAA